MKFLVILVCLLINHYWRKERFLPGEQWFASYRAGLDRQLDRIPGQERLAPETTAVLRCLVLIALPCLLLWLLLWLAAGEFLSFATLLLHVAILLLLFDRCNINALTEEYLLLWRRGEFEAALVLLQDRMPGRMQGRFEDYMVVHQRYCDLMLASHFERLFVLVFWYLVLGPLAALAYALSRLYLQEEGGQTPWRWQEGSDAPAVMSSLLFILEYLPARLLVLTFALAGNFMAAFTRLRQELLSFMPGFNLVKLGAIAAIGNRGVREDDVEPELEVMLAETGVDEAAHTGMAEHAARQLNDLQSLLLRSQVIWLAVLALMILYGVGNRL